MIQNRTLRRSLAVGTALLTVIVAVYLAYDWRFWVRHFRSPSDATLIFDTAWYSPLARIGEGPGRDIPSVTVADSGLDPQALNDVLAYAKSKDSYAFLVMHDGRLVAEAYKDGFGPDSIFDTQSMHKGLVSLAFGAAVDHGLIPSIDVPAATYLPEWANDARKIITIRDILSNQSGLADPGFEEKPWSAGYRLFIGTHIDDLVLTIPAAEPPRTRVFFNHANSQILHAILTRATGMTYVEFMRKYMWEPLGNGAAQVRLDEPGGSARVACCFQTTARSWARIGQMLLDGGKVGDVQVLSSDWIAEATRGTALNPTYGFHIIHGRPLPVARGAASPRAQAVKASEPLAADDVYYLEGRGGQRTLWIPSKKLAIIRIGKIDFTWDDAKVVNPLVMHQSGH